MRIVPVVLAALLLAPAASIVSAGHCSSWTTSTSGTSTVILSAAGYHVVVEANYPPFHLYQESNGINGLQRADSTRNDTCHGQIASDLHVLL